MNDVTYVEAARGLAARMIRDGGPTSADRAEHGFRLVTARRPTTRELDILTRGLARHFQKYRDDKQSAEQLVSIGDSTPDPEFDVVELAAFTALANTLLNLDETINKP